MTNEDQSLSERILTIIGAPNELASKVYATRDKDIISIKIDGRHEISDFFNIDLSKKIVYFHEYPKSSVMEEQCSDLVKYLQKQGYEITGLNDFINHPRFKPQPKGTTEFSMF